MSDFLFFTMRKQLLCYLCQKQNTMFGLPTHLQNTADAELKQIMQRVVMLQNGAVASQMAKSGVRGLMNYGVAVTDLRRIAAETGTNHELARRLCPLNIREARILASMLFDAAQLTADDLGLIFNSITNIDMAENFARNIIGKTANCEFYNRLVSGGKWHILAAIHGVGWAVTQGAGKEIAAWFVSHLEAIAEQAIPETLQPLLTTMESVARTSEANRAAIVAKAAEMAASESAFSQTLGRQYQWLATDSPTDNLS